MKTIEELKKYENELAEEILRYLKENEEHLRVINLDNHMSNYFASLIGEDVYCRNEVNCTGVIDEVVKYLKSKQLIDGIPNWVFITKKGKLVEKLSYKAYSKLKGWAMIDFSIEYASRFVENSSIVLGLLYGAASILILKLTGLLPPIKEFLCRLLQDFLLS